MKKDGSAISGNDTSINSVRGYDMEYLPVHEQALRPLDSYGDPSLRGKQLEIFTIEVPAEQLAYIDHLHGDSMADQGKVVKLGMLADRAASQGAELVVFPDQALNIRVDHSQQTRQDLLNHQAIKHLQEVGYNKVDIAMGITFHGPDGLLTRGTLILGKDGNTRLMEGNSGTHYVKGVEIGFTRLEGDQYGPTTSGTGEALEFLMARDPAAQYLNRYLDAVRQRVKDQQIVEVNTGSDLQEPRITRRVATWE